MSSLSSAFRVYLSEAFDIVVACVVLENDAKS